MVLFAAPAHNGWPKLAIAERWLLHHFVPHTEKVGRNSTLLRYVDIDVCLSIDYIFTLYFAQPHEMYQASAAA